MNMKSVIKCAKLIEVAGVVETENPRKAKSIIFFQETAFVWRYRVYN